MKQSFWNLLLASPFVFGMTVVTAAAGIAVEVPGATKVNQLQKAQVQLSDTQAVTPVATSEPSVLDGRASNITNPITPQVGATALAESSVKGVTSSNTVLQQLTNPVVSKVTDSLGQVTSAQAVAPVSTSEPSTLNGTSNITNPTTQQTGATSLAQLSSYSNEKVTSSQPVLPQNTNVVASKKDSLAQVTSVSQLSDVQPTDWAFQALQSLVERYGCIVGYPDGTYRGNRALTRYEFAAGLNACLDRVNELIATATSDLVTREDLATLQRLQEEFGAELATLRGRVDALEAVTAELEANQFSTTTKLNGEVVTAVSDTFGDELGDLGFDDNTVFQGRARLNFDTSFFGTDQLRTRLQAGNFNAFNYVGNITNEGQLAFATDTDNEFELNDLFYNFRLGEKISVWLLVNSGEYDDFVTAVDTLITATGTGAVSNFSFNPIYNAGGQGAGLGVDFQFTDAIKLTFGYQGGEASDPGEGAGIFNGSYSALGRIEYASEPFQLALVYLHTYDAAANTSEQGSIRSQVIVDDRQVVGNHYGVEASLQLSPKFRLSAWGGLTKARVLGLGDADVWNYAVTLDLPDFGKEGNLLSFIVGVEPYLAATDGFLVDGRRDDPDNGLHIEGFYRYQLTDNISITPGVIWLTAPGHDNDNDDIIVGTIRTTFQF